MTSHQPVRASIVVLAIASTSFVTACAASRPTVAGASSPAPPAQADAARSSSHGALPTSGTVAISEEVRRACGIPDEDAYFAFDSSTLESADISPLSAVARCFTVGPLKGRSLRLVGHADPRGSPEYNMTLGQGRADSVEIYLDRHGVPHSRIATTTRGAIDAVGTEEASWAHDRRVDVMLGSGRGG